MSANEHTKVTFEELLNANVNNLPLRTKTNAFFSGTEAFASFIEEVMVPLLQGLLQPNDKELAVIGTYYRICLHVRSLKALNNIHHFQAVASIVRSLFELWIDLKLLAADTSGDAVRKYHLFSEVERFRVAEELVNFDVKYPDLIKIDLNSHRKFIQDIKRIKKVAKAKIPTNKGKAVYPKHWFDNGNLRERAKKIGLETEYIEVYPLLSWYVHSGPTGIAGLSYDTFECCFALCHSHAQKMLLDATIVCATVTRISDATIDRFNGWMQELRLKPGLVITEEQVKQIRENKSNH